MYKVNAKKNIFLIQFKTNFIIILFGYCYYPSSAADRRVLGSV